MVNSKIGISIAVCLIVMLAGGCASVTVPPTATLSPPTATLSPPSPTVALLPASVPVAAPYWPTEGWRTSPPEEQEMDPALLAQMFETIEEQDLNVHGVVVVHNGYIVAESYYGGHQEKTKHRLYSCTKSFASALVGIAMQQGHITDLQTPAVDFFPTRSFDNLDARKRSMTLEDLLTMRSGLDWHEGDRTYGAMMRSRDWVHFVLDQPMAEQPGQQFNYCSGCSHILSAIVQESTGMPTLEFAQTYLFDPLGITDFEWDTDAQGIPNGGWGLRLTPRDMARFGYLYLNQGVWDGQQVVPADWVRASTQPHARTDGPRYYGYQWWVNPDLNAYSARGRYAQRIVVLPDENLVVVFTARLENAEPLNDLIERFIVPAVSL